MKQLMDSGAIESRGGGHTGAPRPKPRGTWLQSTLKETMTSISMNEDLYDSDDETTRFPYKVELLQWPRKKIIIYLPISCHVLLPSCPGVHLKLSVSESSCSQLQCSPLVPASDLVQTVPAALESHPFCTRQIA